jgi:hypothetical protein
LAKKKSNIKKILILCYKLQQSKMYSRATNILQDDAIPRSNIPASGNKLILVGTGGKNQRIRQESSKVSRKSPEKSDDIPDRNTASMIR